MWGSPPWKYKDYNKSVHWCELCPRKAAVLTDIGPLCWHCHCRTTAIGVWLLEKCSMRPMTREEKAAHECRH